MVTKGEALVPKGEALVTKGEAFSLVPAHPFVKGVLRNKPASQ